MEIVQATTEIRINQSITGWRNEISFDFMIEIVFDVQHQLAKNLDRLVGFEINDELTRQQHVWSNLLIVFH